MKSLLFKLGVILIGLAIFGCAEVWGADWKIYATGKGVIYYYKPDSIIRSSKDTAKVWTKEEYIAERILKERSETPGISYKLTYEEIHCAEKRIRPLSFVSYSQDGEVLGSANIPRGREEEYWAFIVPDSINDRLYKLLCK